MPVVDGLPVPVVRWHVAPRQPAAGPPEHPVDHRPVIGPTTTPLRLLAGQQRFQPGPFLIGQIVSIEHPLGLPHPLIKIRGTRSSGADAPARPDVWWGSGRIVRWHCVSRYEPPLAVGGLPPVARTPDLRWLRPPGRMSPCRLPTRPSSVVVPSS